MKIEEVKGIRYCPNCENRGRHRENKPSLISLILTLLFAIPLIITRMLGVSGRRRRYSGGFWGFGNGFGGGRGFSGGFGGFGGGSSEGGETSGSW
ncbi:MAG: hypothetical protein V2A53_02460 [bacterium]